MEYQCLQGQMDITVDKLVYHSAQTCENSIFVCIQGGTVDGHDYVDIAIGKGATAIVCDRKLKVAENITLIYVNNTREALAYMSATYFGYPGDKLTTIGVTGTKGKTTTTYMIKKILDEAGLKTGLIGTIKIDTGDQVIPSEHTTPESYKIQEYLGKMVEAGCHLAVIEVSSQALMLNRVAGIDFDYGVFTNIEKDHIGPKEHESFEAYGYWKSKLFQQCKVGIINGDDPHKDLIIKDHTCHIERYGFASDCDIRSVNFNIVKMAGKLGVEFQLKGAYPMDLVVGVPGRFTCYNCMAAIAVCRHLQVEPEQIKKALKKVVVPGRQEMIQISREKVLMIDYAHNGTALRCLLEALREYEPKRLTCVFGCGGERDCQRRYKMGEAAAKLADFTIITSDNPRNEQPMSIINDIIEEMKKYPCQYLVIPDRREAIEYAVNHCQNGEIAVIAGKGHEAYQIIGEQKLHFDDREEALASIEKVKNEQNHNKRN